MPTDRRALATLLLVAQSGLDLLAAVGLSTYARLTGATALLAVPELVAFAGPVGLLVLAAGILRRSEPARVIVFAWEAATIAGNLFSIVSSRGGALTLTVGLTGLALPGAIIWLLVRRPPSRSDLRKGLGVGLLLSSALIHLALAPEHWSQPPRLGGLFVLDAAAMAGVAVAAARNLRWWRPAAVALLLASILAYVAVVLGRRESVDDLAVATKLVELLALGLVLLPAQVRLDWRWVGASAGLIATILLSGGLAWAALLRPGAGSDHHATGKQLIAAAAPTDAQRAAATQLVEDTRAGIQRFTNLQAALAQGYRPSTPPTAATVHYVNQAYVHDNRTLDPTQPEALVYANTRAGPLLLGAMYLLPRAQQPPPDVGGALAEWHTHTNLCFTLPRLTIDGMESVFGTCPVGSINAPTPAMLHVWIVANPAGPFADLDPTFVARLVRGQ